MAQSRLEEIRKSRLDKLQKLRSLGVNPYPARFSKNITPIEKVKTLESKVVSTAGRLWRWREHGNVIFADLRDESGQIQLLFQKKNLGDDFSTLKLFDVGDFLGVEGKVITTQAGEITIDVSSFELLTKSIRPLPDDWHGLKDEESRYRQRYVDLLLNPDLKDIFRKKAIFWQSMRNFLIEKDFTEVETPVLETTAGGADANPFATHHNALDIDLYLRISMGELWQKRLMVGGFEKTFEIGRQFRNEGISREHLQDYTQMEFYWAYANYEDSMQLVEQMYKHVAKSAFGTLEFTIGEFKVDLSKPWGKIDFSQTILEHTGVDISTADLAGLQSKLKELKVGFGAEDDKGRLMDLLWKTVRKSVGGPVFLVGHPVEVSPLAKRMHTRQQFVERYQVIIAGSEVGNGYSELNDPIDQAERFAAQQSLRDKGDEEAQMHDFDFVRALEYGMPPVSGFGVSERLFSFLANLPIREAVLFPLLRPEESATKGKKNDESGYQVSPDVSQKFPGISFAYLTIKGVKIKKSNKNLDFDKKQLAESKRSLTNEEIQKIPAIAAYRSMLKATGVDYHSRRPSPEALLRRLVQGKDLYSVNTAVDAYNLAVLETGISLGGFDLDTISEPISLRFSEKGESIHLLGDDKPTQTEQGELVYSDAKTLLTLDLNYRDNDATKITEKTKDILLIADGGLNIDPEDVMKALLLGASSIQKYNGGQIGEIKLVQ